MADRQVSPTPLAQVRYCSAARFASFRHHQIQNIVWINIGPKQSSQNRLRGPDWVKSS